MNHGLILVFTVVLFGACAAFSGANERVQDLLQRLDLKVSDEVTR